MFIDGLVYTNIAKNIYYGIGSLWAPIVDGGGPIFYDHPVLLPFIQSAFFHLFGDTRYTEDLYNLTVLGLTVYFMYLIWKRLVPKAGKFLFFFPLLLFSLSQEIQLRYANTMLECGLTLVTLITTYGYLVVREKNLSVAALMTGLGAVVAFLCKGPVGLFVLALPFLYTLVVDRKLSIVHALLPLLSMIVCFSILFVVEPDALSFLTKYLDHQVLASIRGERGENMANSRFDIVWGLVILNLPALIICALLLLIKAPLPQPKVFRNGLVLVLVGASAILPLTVSIKQASYYQVPSLPYFFLGLSLLLFSRVDWLITYLTAHRSRNKYFTWVTGVALLASVIYALSMINTVDRRDIVPLQQAARIDQIMDSLGIDHYQLIITGKNNPGLITSLDYTVTGSLNRFYNKYQDYTKTSSFAISIKTEGGSLPTERFERIDAAYENLLVGKLLSQ